MKKTRSKSQKARDEKKVAELYLKGWIQSAIATKLDLSQPTISKTLANLRDEWRESSLIDLSERKSIELAKIDHLETTYWDGWKRSLRKRGTITEEGVMPISALLLKEELKRVKVVSSASDGNPTFLTGVQWCIDRRCKILGLDAPKKVDGNTDSITWLAFINGEDTEEDPSD